MYVQPLPRQHVCILYARRKLALSDASKSCDASRTSAQVRPGDAVHADGQAESDGTRIAEHRILQEKGLAYHLEIETRRE